MTVSKLRSELSDDELIYFAAFYEVRAEKSK